MLRGQGEFWVQNQGARYGGTGTARHSDTVNYAGGALGHAPPSTEYVMNVSYGANAAMQAQPDGGGDQLGPLPTQVSAGNADPPDCFDAWMLAPAALSTCPPVLGCQIWEIFAAVLRRVWGLEPACPRCAGAAASRLPLAGDVRQQPGDAGAAGGRPRRAPHRAAGPAVPAQLAAAAQPGVSRVLQPPLQRTNQNTKAAAQLMSAVQQAAQSGSEERLSKATGQHCQSADPARASGCNLPQLTRESAFLQPR
jgi:hypothetical protein